MANGDSLLLRAADGMEALRLSRQRIGLDVARALDIRLLLAVVLAVAERHVRENEIMDVGRRPRVRVAEVVPQLAPSARVARFPKEPAAPVLWPRKQFRCRNT